MIVSVYIDESGTHGSPVTILGGWVGRLGQWATFDPKWQRLLKRGHLTYFHSKKLKHTQGEFKGWTVAQKKEFMAAAAKLGTKNLGFGFAIILGEDDYQAHYVAGHRPKEVQLDSRYGLCFRYCLGIIPELAMQTFKQEDLEISFVLESGHVNYGDADRIFSKVKKSRLPNEQKIIRTLKSLTTGDKIDFPGLQMADVIAYNAFQHATKTPFPTVPLSLENPNDYVARARKLQRVPIYHLRLAAELKQLKRFSIEEIEEKKARREKLNPSSASSQERSS